MALTRLKKPARSHRGRIVPECSALAATIDLPAPQLRCRRALPVHTLTEATRCFWHGCPRHFIKPRQNAAFWRKKIAANRTRDRLVTRTLRKLGWEVLRVWEHELTRKNEARLLRRLASWMGRSA